MGAWRRMETALGTSITRRGLQYTHETLRMHNAVASGLVVFPEMTLPKGAQHAILRECLQTIGNTLHIFENVPMTNILQDNDTLAVLELFAVALAKRRRADLIL